MHVGLDFGTTNSALAVVTDDGAVKLATFELDHQDLSTFRSVLYCHPAHRHRNRRPRLFAGNQALHQYLEDRELIDESGTRGRLIQSLKSHLSSVQFTQTSLYGTSYTLGSMIGFILSTLREAAEAKLGEIGTRVTVGRPVRFSGASTDEEETLALGRIEAAVREAGFDDITFELEPVAAAYHYGERLEQEELALIADFGGGTSDFSLVRLTPGGRGTPEIVGTSGVGVGGDTFDSRIIRKLVTPLLGEGSEYRSPFGRELPVPAWLFTSFERWHHLSFLRTARTIETIRDIRSGALEKERIDALRHVVENNLGYELYCAVERTKHQLSMSVESSLDLDEPPLELCEPILREDFERWIAPDLAAIEACVDEVFATTGVKTEQVDRVFLTGGSSLVPAVRRLFEKRHGADRLRGGRELTSVAEGLALRAASG